MDFCPSSSSTSTHWTDFTAECVRNLWATALPALFVAFFILPVPWLRVLPSWLVNSFAVYLPIHEAEILNNTDTKPSHLDSTSAASIDTSNTAAITGRWKTIMISFFGLGQTLAWLAIGSYALLIEPAPSYVWLSASAYITSLTWLYTTIYPLLYHPTNEVPRRLFVVYCLHLVGAVVRLGGAIYDTRIFGTVFEDLAWAAWVGNLAVVVVLLGIVLSMPCAVPGAAVDTTQIGRTISPEDYATLFDWITFNWVYPILRFGRYNTLNESDVWDLSLTLQSRLVFAKFASASQGTLLRKIWLCNRRDIILDFFLTLISVIFAYMGPFFLRNILEAIDTVNPTAQGQAKAYIFAALAFLCTVAKAQADVQHLWFGRRAATRVRSQLMAAIYDKALKRKDLSGLVDKDRLTESSAGKDEKKGSKKKGGEKEKEDPSKGGADVGKIVNLMAGDANRVAMLLSGIYFVYGGPFEIVIALTFLYQLLGLSAFAGFGILIATWPFNSFITKRSIRIQKELLAARDKRMGVLNELIGAIKFIKFFAWEKRWIDRAMDSREVEIQWMIKARFNMVMFSMIWALSPILVSIISFTVYVYQGNQLTVSIAFTSIALFTMLRNPLNVLPTWIVQALQTKVALDRIAAFLDEEEVTDQVSVLRREEHDVQDIPDEGLGLENATLRWNEAASSKDADSNGNGKQRDVSTEASASTSTVHSTQSTQSESATSTSTGNGHRFELKDMNIMFPEGQLSVVTGPTASGKTALLMALLGEMTLVSGRIVLGKDPNKVLPSGLIQAVSYAAQSPWLRHQSIKDNILFGTPWNEERYEQVVECCALRPDLELLEDGDLTEIGARGVSLSGGQKARVALARAVYARTKYVLLDDPLSAVDSHTSRFLFEKLLCGPLLQGRTVVLVTHHVELVLPGTYYLVRMLDGRIDTQGTVKHLRSEGLLDDIKHDSTVQAIEQEQTRVVPEDAMGTVETEEPTLDAPVARKKPRQLIKDEHREVGGIKWSVYKTYLKASSYYIWVFLALIVVVSQATSVFEKYWIKKWGEGYGPEGNATLAYHVQTFTTLSNEFGFDLAGHRQQIIIGPRIQTAKGDLGIDWPDANERPLFYVGIYAAIGLATAFFTLLSVTAQYVAALWASRNLFERLLVKVVRATMRWHDVTPQGRMLNRFGKDIETIDSSLAGTLQSVNSSLATFFGALLTITFIFPWFLLPALVIGFVYRELALGYLHTGRDLRRMESNTKSPIFSDFNEVLEGIVTVRAFSAEKRFLSNLHQKIDVTTKMWYTFWMTNRWLLLNYDALGALAILVTTLFALSGYVKAGTAGLCITSAMSFTTSIYWACRFWTALELDLNSVERVVEYLDLPQEPAAVIESQRPPAYWPSTTSNSPLISVENLTVKYAPELPPVLHDISFALKSGERVGLLGRTGSGKSTMAMSILRFVDPASGRIMIDGIDISSIGLYDLRSRLTFIPQDATLFSGTLRQNLDPFDEHDDRECLDVLLRVQLISPSAVNSQYPSREASRASSVYGVEVNGDERPESVLSTTTTDVDAESSLKLDTLVSAGGANFSQGQRQLIAMARALLRRSSIIILDEATSSIDFATDAKIQFTIREEFKDSLLLTVAHRLRTVIDYDRLIVLDKGKVVEFDTPYNLIQKTDGVFRNMCLKSGTFAELEVVAKAKAESLQP